MIQRSAAMLTATLMLTASTARGEELAQPDPLMTPVAVDPSVTLADICTGTTKTRRGVSPATRAKVLRDYNVSDAASGGMEMDHLVPLAIGGANTAANLWPQPAPDYDLKDRLEVELQRRACRAYETLPLAEAETVLVQEQREITEDWTLAYHRYVLKTLPPPALAEPAASITKRLTAVFRRVSRSWKFGSD